MTSSTLPSDSQLEAMFVRDSAPVYETDAWSRGEQLDERESFFEATSMMTLALWSQSGTLLRTMDANARSRREAAALVEAGVIGDWSECDWYDLFPVRWTPATSPLPADAGLVDARAAAMAMPVVTTALRLIDGVAHAGLAWRPGSMPLVRGEWLLTTPDKCEFTWEPVRDAVETGEAESRARWVEARADAVAVSELEALMMEVPA